MLYIHKHFTLDTSKKNVVNKHQENLYLTGDAYRLLELLCKKYPESITGEDINYDFDITGAKNYSQNYIRNLKNKIKNAINYEIIDYKNAVYSLVGDIQKIDEADAFTGKEEDSGENKLHFLKKFFYSKKVYVFLSSIILILIFFSVLILKLKNNLISSQKVSSDMVLIPAGEFFMGTTEEVALSAYNLCLTEEGESCMKDDYFAEYPQHKVYLKDFFIDKKEVSNEEYKIFVEATGYRQPLFWNDSTLNSPLQPVVGVSWNDAKNYCQWLKKRLPTEEEWEKAARGTDNREWSWGNEWETSKLNHGTGGRPGYDESDGYELSAPIGALMGVSPYGVLNMSGNVFEWAENDFKAYEGNDRFLNGDFGGPYKVYRGGSYVYGKADNRVSARFYGDLDFKDVDLGFRCAKDAL